MSRKTADADVRFWLRVLKKSVPIIFLQLSFVWVELEATLIQKRLGF